MIRKLSLLLFCLMHMQTFALFDSSPWFVFENKTQYDLTCTAQVNCDNLDPNSELKIQSLTNQMTMFQIVDQSNTKCILSFQFQVPAQTKSIIFPMIYYKEKAFLPITEKVSTSSDALQITFDLPVNDQINRHFVAKYEDSLIKFGSNPIDLKTRVQSSIKESLLVSILNLKKIIENNL